MSLWRFFKLLFGVCGGMILIVVILGVDTSGVLDDAFKSVGSEPLSSLTIILGILLLHALLIWGFVRFFRGLKRAMNQSVLESKQHGYDTFDPLTEMHLLQFVVLGYVLLGVITVLIWQELAKGTGRQIGSMALALLINIIGWSFAFIFTRFQRLAFACYLTPIAIMLYYHFFG